MEIEDRIYDIERITEPVLIDLINCPSVQRLKDISQLGIPDDYNCRIGFSRYEHSLGVMVLLRRLGASLEEQVSGLLHDVSHTAFSHVIDWVVGDPTKEDHQDNSHFQKIENSEIPLILKKYDFDYGFVSNPENFSLLEKKAPSLCADRIDYSLREFSLNYDSNLPKTIYENLIVKDSQISFKDKDTAESFAEIYLKLQEISWAGDDSRSRYIILSDALKRGINKKIISLDDFHKTDYFILNNLENSENNYILDRLNLLKKGFRVVESDEGVELLTKFRYIDPEVSVNSSYKKLSDLSKEYSNLLNTEKEKSKLIKKVKIIPL